MLITIVLFPKYISILGTDGSALWFTILSFLVWFSLLDLGIGQNLRMQLLDTKIPVNTHPRLLVESLKALVLIAGVTSTLIIISAVLLDRFFHYELNLWLIVVIVLMFSLQIVFNINNSLLHVIGRSRSVLQIEFSHKILSIFSLIFLYHFETVNVLILFVFTYGLIHLTNFSVLIYLLKSYRVTFYSIISPGFRDYTIVKQVVKKGRYFLIVQLGSLALINAIPIFLYNYYSSDDVLSYSAASRVYISALFIYYAALQPFWKVIVTEGTSRRSLAYLGILWLLFVFGVLTLFYFSEGLYKLWLGSNISYAWSWNISFLIYAVMVGLNSALAYILNANGHIRLQAAYGLFYIVFNIPLSFIISYMNLDPVILLWLSSLTIFISSIHYAFTAKKIVT